MISSHRTPIVPILLVVLLTVPPYARATPQAASASSAAPAAAASRPAAPAYPDTAPRDTTPRSVARSTPVSSVGLNAGSPTEPVLVIPGKPMDPQAVDQVVEDLSVMSRIIEKNAFGEYYTLGGIGEVNAYSLYHLSSGNTMGPGVLFPLVGRAKPMYLGGYGAVFFIQVSYPLLPPPEAPKEQPAGQQEDSVWAEAKRSVFEPQTRPVLPQGESEPVEPYDRQKVGDVRNALVVLMKHAANIRVLEPAERVTIVVQGPAASVPREVRDPSVGPTAQPVVVATAGKTVMTLGATKADLDLYAKGQLNQQQFEQRLQIVTY